MWRLRRLVRHIVAANPGIPVLLSLAAAIAAGSWAAMPGESGTAMLVAVLVLALVLALLLVLRLVIGFEDFAQGSLRQDRIAQGLRFLYHEVEPRLPLPPVEGWTLDPRTLVLVIRTMRARRPEAIVEFGAGVSTLVLAQVAQEIGARLYSFEHDIGWYRRVHAWVAQCGLDGTAVVHHAPLQRDGDGVGTWYDRRVVADALPPSGIGLVLVDGPPSRAGHRIRAGALPAVHEHSAKEVTVVMDDSDRPDEQAIVSEWCAAYPQLRLETVTFEHDVAILTSLPEGRPWVRDD